MSNGQYAHGGLETRPVEPGGMSGQGVQYLSFQITPIYRFTSIGQDNYRPGATIFASKGDSCLLRFLGPGKTIGNRASGGPPAVVNEQHR